MLRRARQSTGLEHERGAAMVFQNMVVSAFTVNQNVASACDAPACRRRKPARVDDMLERVRLTRIAPLSQGFRATAQRVAIARDAHQPKCCCSTSRSRAATQVAQELPTSFWKPPQLPNHLGVRDADLDEASRSSDKVAYDAGAVEQFGAPGNLIEPPRARGGIRWPAKPCRGTSSKANRMRRNGLGAPCDAGPTGAARPAMRDPVHRLPDRESQRRRKISRRSHACRLSGPSCRSP